MSNTRKVLAALGIAGILAGFYLLREREPATTAATSTDSPDETSADSRAATTRTHANASGAISAGVGQVPPTKPEEDTDPREPDISKMTAEEALTMRGRPRPDVPLPKGRMELGPGPYIDRYDGRSGLLQQSMTLDQLADRPYRDGSDGAEGFGLLAWPRKSRFTAPEQVEFCAAVIRSNEKLVPDELVLGVDAIVRAGDTNTALHFHAQPASLDECRFAASAPIKALVTANPHAGPRTVYAYVTAKVDAGEGRIVQKQTRTTAEVHERRVWADKQSFSLKRANANLVFSFKISVSTPGRYHAYAELWGGGPDRDKPIAFARDHIEMTDTTPRNVELLFGGQILRDLRVNGPYEVRNLRLKDVGDIPPTESDPLISTGVVSPPWPAQSFGSDE